MADDKDTPQFEKDAKKTRDSFMANLILGKRKDADAKDKPEPAPAVTRPMGGNNPANKGALEAMKKGGKVKKFAAGGKVDGIAQRGKTRGKQC
jgi:hypothetical protein